MSYLDDLNEVQRRAVEYKNGPSLVIAGAGSGKTRVLTYKIVDLLENGFAPNRILALTFTNKAAREMKERIASLIGEEKASKLWMGTFHSIFLRILRRHADLIGYKPNFTIYDTSDSKSLVKMIIKDLCLDENAYKPSSVLSHISRLKNALVTPEIYKSDEEYRKADFNNGRPYMDVVYETYCDRCYSAGAMDFDDILLKMNILLRDRPDVALHYQKWFEYVLVDEYQDTNLAQHMIIRKLLNEQKLLCVVGDDAQSIYSFRGAEISNILSLQNLFPDLAVFKLEQNYRSTQNIVNAAGSLIAKNRNQIAKNVFSKNEVGDKIGILKAPSDFEEAYRVVGLISKMQMTWHDSFDDYAILYRTNAQSRLLEEALRKRSIPYRIYGGVAFYQRKEVKDVISYFRLAVNPDDDEALRRVINYPARGIGATTMGKIIAEALEKKVSLWTVITNPDKYPLKINAGTAKKLANFSALIREFVKDVENGSNAFEVGQLVLNRTGILLTFQHDGAPEDIARQQNLEDLLSGLNKFVQDRNSAGMRTGMNEYLAEISLLTDQDEDDDTESAKVTLMTVHSAKGLEFKHVIITGLEKNLFPSGLATTPKELEEERRLMYVAMTRAQSTCDITFAATRMLRGETMATEPSPFIEDIDARYKKFSNGYNSFPSPSPFINPRSQNRTSFTPQTSKFEIPKASRMPSDNFRPLKELESKEVTTQQHTASELKSGMKILHNRFGAGTILAVEAQGGEIIQVEFSSGVKKLMLRYAKFDIIG